MGVNFQHYLIAPILTVLVCIRSNGQDSPYKFSSEIDKALAADTIPFRFQLAASEYSLIGEYWQAMSACSRQLSSSPEALPEQQALLAGYKPVDAETYVLEKATEARVIIFNERHFQPAHRAFLANLLRRLKAAGYEMMAVEAIDKKDSLLNERKYPVINTGYYTREAGFGNLLRTALETGILVYPYESDAGDWKEREARQARNIAALLAQHPDKKLIVYCGLDHVLEDSLHMAGRLKLLTGIDPFTVDQVQLSETGDPKTDNPFRKLMRQNRPTVFVGKDGRPFNKAAANKKVDCHVYHPNTFYIDGRPAWQFTTETMPVRLDSLIQIPCACLVKVYGPPYDTDNQVPEDVVELASKKDKSILVRKNIRYTVVATNEEGEEQRLTIGGQINPPR
jgi:hypothetical protein